MSVLLAFAFVSGLITILSPCILPVLPVGHAVRAARAARAGGEQALPAVRVHVRMIREED
jgi:cytochrome c biogenesis protein CcdA